MSNLSPFDAWIRSFKEEQESVMATILQLDQSQAGNEPVRLFISRENVSIGDLGDEEINLRVTEIARRKLNETNPKSETRTFTLPDGKEINVFIDVYFPPAELMIFGAGHDAIPVAKYAVSLGFKTTVVDQREFYNSEQRFPGTNRLIVNTSDFHENIKIGRRTYIVVMNHHIEKDKETLKFVLRSSSPYIGVLGPRSRRDRMLKALEDEGIFFSVKELERMYSPIGLDIGAVSSEEIAISILAEVIAKKSGHTGGFLQGSEFIHHAANSKTPV
ncbi:XdhC family protein [Bacillus sp. FJAT-29790]|uniref:XdhC family protein n=1 Tax=Bacillus sp. FJAT-29790 TaxID=1895002 RepID=UPI001C233EE2|nr:XdhC family protein [Bacillus sp. FJAT-29790]MBU8880732.1 XdhC family protein [Bacillus sp. FJAT-29790]